MNALADPTLELRDHNGTLIRGDNDWQDDAMQAAEISANGLAPTNAKEAAIVASLAPGMYTATLAGNNSTSGVGLVEIYDANAPSFFPQHLYVGNDNAGGEILQFTLPLTSSTTSNFTMTGGGNRFARDRRERRPCGRPAERRPSVLPGPAFRWERGDCDIL